MGHPRLNVSDSEVLHDDRNENGFVGEPMNTCHLSTKVKEYQYFECILVTFFFNFTSVIIRH